MESKLTKEERSNLESFSSPKVLAVYDKFGLTSLEKKIVEKYFSKRNAEVLDIGCGLGRTTIPLYEMGFDVVGIDISTVMIEKTKANYPNVDIRVGNASDLRFPDRSFDYVLFSFNGIDYIYPEEKRITALKEINRILKSKGIFVFSTHNPWQIASINIRHYYWLLQFIVLNIIKRRIFSRYKVEKSRHGELTTYYINPFDQEKQLRDNGFDLLEITGKFNNRLKYFEPWLYYVAKKRE